MTKPLFIAEVKTQSPFGLLPLKSSPDGFSCYRNWDGQFEIANKLGDIISIHTESPWGGSTDLITKAKARTDKPILAKGFHHSLIDIHNSLLCGADYVLCIRENNEDLKYLLSLSKIGAFDLYKGYSDQKLVIEAWNLAQLHIIEDLSYIYHYFPMVVWNQRDLKTGKPKVETFEEVRKIFKGNLIQASLLKNRSDISPEADGVLVGTHLENFL